MIIAPLGLVLAARLLQRRATDAGTLFGLAIWRSSFSGLAPILPALILQLAALGAMGGAKRRTVPPLIQQAAHLALIVALAAVLVVQVWEIAATPSRRALAITTYTVAPRCVPRASAPT